ncbi:MAG TPA: N-acetyltransferase [Caulobacteraceae bacterium]|nr:N-acetyltransferase [Caulobacteraceae bacterium]
MRVAIRPETPADADEVRVLLAAAFPGPGEARLVERLRAEGDAALALVAIEAGRIAGHVTFSPMAAPFRALGLGPLAVAPDRQRIGIGSHLVRDGLHRAYAEGWQAVFVLGDPDYYGRFGFDQDLASDFVSPYAGPHLMVLSLGGGPLPTTEGKVDYAPAFAALG